MQTDHLKDVVFYDGHCGLCHGWVKFLLTRDQQARFRYAPLDGDTFRSVATEDVRERLPDSIVVVDLDGKLRTEVEAIAYLLGSLGGKWKRLAAVLRAIPSPITKAGYRMIASMRTVFFGRPEDVCPVVPSSIRERFIRN